MALWFSGLAVLEVEVEGTVSFLLGEIGASNIFGNCGELIVFVLGVVPLSLEEASFLVFGDFCLAFIDW